MMTKTNRLSQMILDTIPHVRRSITSILRQDGISESFPNLQVLRILDTYPCASMGFLASQQGVTLPSMSMTISRLVEKGHVSRKRSMEDRRKVVLELTSSGKEILDAAREKASAEVIGLVSHLSLEEQDTLMAALNILMDIFGAPANYPYEGSSIGAEKTEDL